MSNIKEVNMKKKSQEKIIDAFMKLIKNKEIDEITITELVKLAKVNRSTFYVNYIDVYDLANKIKKDMYYDLLRLYENKSITKKHSYDFLKLFKHIKNNQDYYKTMFKLNFNFIEYYNNSNNYDEAIKYLGTSKNIDYHIEFFKAGISSIIKLWLYNGCVESPEEIAEIIKLQYQKRI